MVRRQMVPCLNSCIVAEIGIRQPMMTMCFTLPTLLSVTPSAQLFPPAIYLYKTSEDLPLLYYFVIFVFIGSLTSRDQCQGTWDGHQRGRGWLADRP